MAQKKCPKCGENNPPEAVMCWACYTPLSTGSSGVPASAASAGGRGSTGSSSDSAGAKKPMETWQLGIVGVGLLVAVVMGGRTLMGSGGEDTEQSVAVSAAPPTQNSSYVPSAAPSSPSSPSNTSPAINRSSGITPAAAPAGGQMAFTVSVPPRRGVSWATMAIVPTQANVNPQTAAALAASARQQVVTTGNWTGLYIYVFKDQTAAARLRAYQSQRRGQPLDEKGYQELRSVWPSVLARYEYSKGWEAIRYPSANPTGWWQGQSRFGKAKL